MHFATGQLMGVVAKPPTVFTTQAGKTIVTLRVAVVRPDHKGEERTNYIGVKTFGKSAEIAEKLVEGVEILATGKLETETWTSKEGAKQYALVLVASDLVATGGRPSAATRPPAERPQQSGFPASGSSDIPDLPF